MKPSTPVPDFKPLRPPRTSLMYTLPLRRLRDILNNVVPKLMLTSVEDLPSTKLPRLYKLNLSDDTHLLLSVAPSLSIRLLRQEQTLLSSEAIIIHFLQAKVRHGSLDIVPSSPPVDGSRSSYLVKVVPKLLKHSSNTRDIGYPYTIFDVGSRVPSSTVSTNTVLEQRIIDKQIGALVRELASLRSPSGNFGTVSRVCGDPFPISGASISHFHPGLTRWVEAFMSLMEGILRDGEDMSVLLPYEAIRAHSARLSWRLGAVTVPRLLIMDVGDASNVMVERSSEDGSSAPDRITLTGLRDWSQGVFGDPLLSSCFERPSESFMEGWRPEGSEDLIEGEDGARTRLLLYRCYRAVVNIVTDYYRPQVDSSRRELEGRKELTSALTELENTDIDQSQAIKRPRSSTSEFCVWNASKRQCIETEAGVLSM